MTFRTLTLRTGLSLAAASLFVYACSGDDTSATKSATDSGVDTGAITTRPDSSTGADSSSGGTDAGDSDSSKGSDTGTGTDTGVDATPPATTIAYAGCADPDAGTDGGSGTAFQDFGTSDAVVTFGGTNPGEAYSPKCIKIKAGHMVTWNAAAGDTFASHPLAGAPGNPASPAIPTTATGTTQSVTFPTAGVYGFYCQFHGIASGSPAAMNGVVLVE